MRKIAQKQLLENILKKKIDRLFWGNNIITTQQTGFFFIPKAFSVFTVSVSSAYIKNILSFKMFPLFVQPIC